MPRISEPQALLIGVVCGKYIIHAFSPPNFLSVGSRGNAAGGSFQRGEAPMSAQDFEQFYRSMSGKAASSTAVALLSDVSVTTQESPAQQRKRVRSDRAQARQIAEQIRQFCRLGDDDFD